MFELLPLFNDGKDVPNFMDMIKTLVLQWIKTIVQLKLKTNVRYTTKITSGLEKKAE